MSQFIFVVQQQWIHCRPVLVCDAQSLVPSWQCLQHRAPQCQGPLLQDQPPIQHGLQRLWRSSEHAGSWNVDWTGIFDQDLTGIFDQDWTVLLSAVNMQKLAIIWKFKSLLILIKPIMNLEGSNSGLFRISLGLRVTLIFLITKKILWTKVIN